MFAIYAGKKKDSITMDLSEVDYILATFDTVSKAQLYLDSLGPAGRAYNIAKYLPSPHNPEPKKTA